MMEELNDLPRADAALTRSQRHHRAAALLGSLEAPLAEGDRIGLTATGARLSSDFDMLRIKVANLLDPDDGAFEGPASPS